MAGKIPLAGVIGSPDCAFQVTPAASPLVKNLWDRGDYIPMDVASQDLGEVLRALPKAGFVGVNVTIPHKETILEIADLVTDRATLIGAANTLIFRKDGKIHADNTDGYGFIENLKSGRAPIGTLPLVLPLFWGQVVRRALLLRPFWTQACPKF